VYISVLDKNLVTKQLVVLSEYYAVLSVYSFYVFIVNCLLDIMCVKNCEGILLKIVYHT